MKKIILSIALCFAIITLNAQQPYVKYEFMKVLPGQDYEKMEQSWVNYHNELIKAGIITTHRIWKVLPGSNVDYDYVVTTVFHNYADALGIGKTISTADFKAKYPQDYQVMNESTLKTRTMVRELIVKLELAIDDSTYVVEPGKTLLNMIFVKSKNDNYDKAEIKFSNKWHQYLVDKKRKEAFYFLNVVGSNGIDVEYSHVISHWYKNIDQLTNGANLTDIKLTQQEQADFNKLVSYRDLKKSVLFLNVQSLEKK